MGVRQRVPVTGMGVSSSPPWPSLPRNDTSSQSTCSIETRPTLLAFRPPKPHEPSISWTFKVSDIRTSTRRRHVSIIRRSIASFLVGVPKGREELSFRYGRLSIPATGPRLHGPGQLQRSIGSSHWTPPGSGRSPPERFAGRCLWSMPATTTVRRCRGSTVSCPQCSDEVA
jgi:hypothetical protein